MNDLDLKNLQKTDPLKRMVEKETGKEEFSPMDPPEAYKPPNEEVVPYKDMHPLLQRLTDEHKACIREIDVFETIINELREKGIDQSMEGKLNKFFDFFDNNILPHNRLEERTIFPLLHRKLLEKGEHSKGYDKETPVDMMEDEHVKVLQLGAVAFNLLALSARITDIRSRMIVLDAAIEQSKLLIDLLRLHIFREDNIVFGLAHKYLSNEEFDSMQLSVEMTNE